VTRTPAVVTTATARCSIEVWESPSSACARGATPYRRRQMREARMKLRLCSQARVVGVAFFDFKHGQTGVAPNAIELHPILGFACLSG
jgi:hypothetical protein